LFPKRGDARSDDPVAWYTPLPGNEKDHGKWSLLRHGATQGNGKVENWFDLLDQ